MLRQKRILLNKLKFIYYLVNKIVLNYIFLTFKNNKISVDLYIMKNIIEY